MIPLFSAHLHIKAEDLPQAVIPDSSAHEKEEMIYGLREEAYVHGDTAYAIKFWADTNGCLFDADDMSYTAILGRWIAQYLPAVNFIYVDFED